MRLSGGVSSSLLHSIAPAKRPLALRQIVGLALEDVQPFVEPSTELVD